MAYIFPTAKKLTEDNEGTSAARANGLTLGLYIFMTAYDIILDTWGWRIHGGLVVSTHGGGGHHPEVTLKDLAVRQSLKGSLQDLAL